MHVLDKCVTCLRLLITYLPSNDVMSLEEFQTVSRAWVTSADWLVPEMMTLSVEDSEEESSLGNTQIPSYDSMSLS